MWHTLRLFLTRESSRRAEYLKKHGIFHAIGEHCTIMDRVVPLYAELISLGNNVHCASNVHFITHDVAHCMLNQRARDRRETTRFQEQVGCIEVGDNVFIGSHTVILGDVRIGSNVIIGGMSLVNRDVPDNCVVAGVPARVIGTFDEFYRKRIERSAAQGGPIAIHQEITDTALQACWTKFHEAHPQSGKEREKNDTE